uniref:Cuticle-degrading serine protease n=1 Tax=Dactylella shizishanna TaxID=415350 RepID=A1YN98_9PEZI|nr:cuticle-degrading serine protease [Dactylella shizishanna]
MKAFTSLIAIAGLATSALAGPILRVINSGAQGTIADKYIVVLKKDVDMDAHTSRISSLHALRARDLTGAKAHGVQRKFNFRSSGFHGYTGGFDAATLQDILKSPEVAFVEQDAVIKLNAEQTDSTWGLDRISHKDFSTPYTYAYDGATAGAGVTVYVIDTGIRITHDEFKSSNGTSRASFGFNAFNDGNTDGNGHGTHCAGTVAGKTYGVAKNAKVVAVKVLNASGSGTNSGVIGGMNYVAQQGTPNSVKVASMSLGGSKSTAINNAVNSMYDANIAVVVAAGNESQDAANVSPASAAKAITVGAIDSANTIASFSNYGSILDVFAPGVNVLSSWTGSDTGTKTISGTSMACPHVAGLAAYYVSLSGLKTSAAVADKIVSSAITGQVKGNIRSSPNKIAYNGNA